MESLTTHHHGGGECYNPKMDIEDRQLHYTEQSFKSLNLTEKTISGKEFEKCRFQKCNFLQSVFIKCRFIDCVFSECMLSAVDFKSCILFETIFEQSKIMGIDWSKTEKVRGLQFIKCDLNLSVFAFIKLSNLVIKDCIAKDVNFMEADCSGANFEGTDFDKSIFQHTNLSSANFKKAFNYAIDFNNNILKKAKFSLPEASSLLRGLDIVIED